MRKKATALFATLKIACILFLSSCSSPEKEGAKLGKSLTDCLGNTGTYKQSSVLLDKKEDCGKKINSDWELAKDKYKNDAGKWKVFVDAYLNATQTTEEELNLNLSKLLSAELSGKLWVRADDSSKDFYIFSFENGVLKFLNCKGEFDYQLKGNVLSFKDNGGTSGTVTIKEGKLILSDLKNNYSIVYRQVENRDKLIGKWNVSGSLVLDLDRNGRCTMGGAGYSTMVTPYTFNNDVLDIKGAGAYKIKTNDWNILPWGQQPLYRVKIAQPDVRKLFGYNESIE